MATATISACPPEVLLRILAFADSFSTIAAFLRTSRYFCALWPSNLTCLATKILPYIVKSSDDALLLVEAQERVALNGVGQHERQNNIYVYALRQIARLEDNERSMLAARHTYEKNIRDNFGRQGVPKISLNWHYRSFNGFRYTLFVRAYYRIWTFALEDSTPQSTKSIIRNNPERDGIALIVGWVNNQYQSPFIMICASPDHRVSSTRWKSAMDDLLDRPKPQQSDIVIIRSLSSLMSYFEDRLLV